MALYVNIGTYQYYWHVGSKPTWKISDDFDANSIVVQADGDELEFIRATFTNILMADSRVVTWYGETAKFIATHIDRVR